MRARCQDRQGGPEELDEIDGQRADINEILAGVFEQLLLEAGLVESLVVSEDSSRNQRATGKAALAERLGRFVSSGFRWRILKIIDFRTIFCYTDRWQTNEHASQFVAATRIGRGSKNAQDASIEGS